VIFIIDVTNTTTSVFEASEEWQASGLVNESNNPRIYI